MDKIKKNVKLQIQNQFKFSKQNNLLVENYLINKQIESLNLIKLGEKVKNIKDKGKNKQKSADDGASSAIEFNEMAISNELIDINLIQ